MTEGEATVTAAAQVGHKDGSTKAVLIQSLFWIPIAHLPYFPFKLRRA